MNPTPETVRELLESEDFGQRLSAINLIRQFDSAIGYELIQPALDDPNARVRYAAISQLSTLGQHDPSTAYRILRDRLLKDPEPDVQAAAADSIGALKLKEALPDLELVYHQTDQWLVQFSIIATLGELGDPRSLELLKTALTSDNDLIKTAAIGSLGELGDVAAVPLLIPFAGDADWQVRYRVVQALGRFDLPAAREAIAPLVNDPMKPVAEEAHNQLSANA
ncbi:MAG: HEAT repeat domain-containing protein [Leptolyngbyaceae cyanobacterium SL_7_1]|nr:HEAT repeat domain-containing protein [Leptolyngbyaceae cyanobacterium SL_7_1]